MTVRRSIFTALVFLSALYGPNIQPSAADGALRAEDIASVARVKKPEVTNRVLIRTDKGDITIALFGRAAPVTVKNFLRYVDAKAYEDGSFFRTVTATNDPTKTIHIRVIQGGARSTFKDFAPIVLERTNHTGVTHMDGAISMARDNPDSATSSFFICIGNQPALDFGGRRNTDGQGFGAFGRVASGMDVVRLINGQPANGQTLRPAVKILSVRRLR